jgi:methionyl-tRNA formyltransferase
VVAAYAQIIPQWILDLPKYGCINIHGSLLPKYRGASCIQAAILNGDKKTGLTIMKMDAGLDTGDILSQAEIEIEKADTADSIYEKLSRLGGEILIPTLSKYINSEITPILQNNEQSSYAKMLKKEDGRIDWTKNALFLKRFIRAMYSWPGAFCNTPDNQLLKILDAEIYNSHLNQLKIGEIYTTDNKLIIKCNEGALIINRLQLEGKKETTGVEFLKGHKNLIGQQVK